MSDAFIIRRGGAVPGKLYIIKEGQLCVKDAEISLTVNDPPNVSCRMSYGSGSLNFSLSGWYNGNSQVYCSLNRPLDIGPYSTLYLDIRQEKAQGGGMGLQRSPGWGEVVASASVGANTSRQIISLDVSGTEGLNHPFFRFAGIGPGKGNSVYIYNFWLER